MRFDLKSFGFSIDRSRNTNVIKTILKMSCDLYLCVVCK